MLILKPTVLADEYRKSDFQLFYATDGFGCNPKKVGANHDDFVDEFIEYQIFEDSMKNSGGGNPRKSNKGSGCGTTAVIIVLIIIVLSVFGSCGKSNQKSHSSGSYQRSYSNSSSSYSGNSSKSGSSESSYVKKAESSTVQPTTKKNTYKSSSSKSKTSKSKDEFSAKDYVDADDFYYDHYDDFYDYEDAEDYWEEHNND